MDVGWEKCDWGKWFNNVFQRRVALRGRRVIVFLVLDGAVTLEAYEDVSGMIGGRLGCRKWDGRGGWGEAEYPGLMKQGAVCVDPLEAVGFDATDSMTTIIRLREF